MIQSILEIGSLPKLRTHESLSEISVMYVSIFQGRLAT